MTLRQRYALSTAVSGVVSALVLLMATEDGRFLYLLLAILFVYLGFLLTLRCRHCGELMVKRKRRIAGVEALFWGGLGVPKNCSRCGARFR
jgi:hypothetical protein